MPIRTTEEAVAGIIEVDSSISLTPFIETASNLTDRVAAGDFPVTLTTLELIERWLSAHFYAQRDPRVTSERAGSVGASYQSAVKTGFKNTHYGQMALALDPTGILASLTEGTRLARVDWLGTESQRGAVGDAAEE